MEAKNGPYPEKAMDRKCYLYRIIEPERATLEIAPKKRGAAGSAAEGKEKRIRLRGYQENGDEVTWGEMVWGVMNSGAK